jgi:hypothetical protein
MRGRGPQYLLYALEKLDDRESESKRRCRRSNSLHHRLLDAEPRAQPSEMIPRRCHDFEPALEYVGTGICHAFPFFYTSPK